MSETPAYLRVDAAVDRYLSQTLLSREAHSQDGQYHLQVQWLRNTLASVDQAMESEGIPSNVRDRVIQRILYGSLDEQAAVARIVTHQAAMERTRSETPRVDAATLEGMFGLVTGATE